MSEPIGEIGPELVSRPGELLLDPNDPPVVRIARLLGFCVMGLAAAAIPALLIFFGLGAITSQPLIPDGGRSSQNSLEALLRNKGGQNAHVRRNGNSDN